MIGALMVLPIVLGNAYYVGIFVFIGIYALMTIGLSLLMGYAGQISLGHAGFFGIGAYASAILTTKTGLSPWPALLVAMGLTAVAAFVIGVPALRLKGHYLAMATLGFGEIMHVIFTATVDLTGGPGGLGHIPRLAIGGWEVRSQLARYCLVWTLVVAVLTLSLNLVHSRVGRALRSIHGSELAANAMGVHTAKYKVQIFVLSAVFASIAGSLYAHFITFVSPSTFELHFSILLVTMVVVGGMTNLWGALIGTVLLGLLPELLREFKDFDVLVYGFTLLVMMMFMPEGLFGLFGRLVGSRKAALEPLKAGPSRPRLPRAGL